MPELIIRNASHADLPRVAEIWYEAATEGESDPPPMRGVPSLYTHELETEDLVVLQRDEEVVGYAAVIKRGSIAFLADLFVAAAHRSTGLGQRLLQAVLPKSGQVCCTVASNDPRALPMYVRAGMRPWWPHVHLRLRTDELKLLHEAQADAVEAEPGDPEWLRWDTQISGRPRPQDYNYWILRRRGVPLWFTRGGRRLGYGMAQQLSDDSVWHPEALTLGPIGALEHADAEACVLAAVQWARTRSDTIRMSVTGPHPALAALLSAGFRIVEVETFCCQAAARPFVDVQRYVSSGGDLF
jgi:GNAT superfamily N-acetyltransferase